MNKTLNNEVTIFGKLIRGYNKIRINNQDAIQLLLEVQDDVEVDKTYKICAYAITNDRNLFKNMIGKEIGINGHIISHMGTKVIIDALCIA